MPNTVSSLLRATLQKTADTLEEQPINEVAALPLELKEAVYNLLDSPRLFAFWQKHHHEEPDVSRLAGEILFKRQDKAVYQMLFKHILEENTLLSLPCDQWLAYLGQITRAPETTPEIRINALTVQLLLMQSHAYNRSQFDFELILKQLIITGQVHQALLITRLGQLTHDDEIQSEISTRNKNSLLKRLMDSDSNVRCAAIEACAALLPSITEKEQKPLVQSVLDGLMDSNSQVCGTAIEACTALLPFVSETERSLLLQGVLRGLTGSSLLLRCAAIEACPALLPFVSETERTLLLKSVLDGLMGSDCSMRCAAIEACAALLSSVSEKEREPLMQGVLRGLTNSNSNVRCAAIKACSVLLPFVSEKEREPLMQGVLHGLTDSDDIHSDVRCAAIESCTVLLSSVSGTEREPLMQGVLCGLTDSNLSVYRAAIKACVALFPSVSEKERKSLVQGVLCGLTEDSDCYVRSMAIETCTALLPFNFRNRAKPAAAKCFRWIDGFGLGCT